MCVDFIDLNKACLKDNFHIPTIDGLMDAFVNDKVLSFMDDFSRYNQISMDLPNQEKMSFIIEEGLYCYKVMSFDLRNARATYQRLVNKLFTDRIGRTMEIYVEDMMVKSSTIEQHNQDLANTFVAFKLLQHESQP